MERLVDPVFDRMLVNGGAQPSISEGVLTAMGAYFRLLSEWDAPAPVAPTLLVQARELMIGARVGGDWRADWGKRHDALDARFPVLPDHLAQLLLRRGDARDVRRGLVAVLADLEHGGKRPLARRSAG